MPERAEFQKIQYALAAHIRDPDKHAAPAGIEDRRLAIYRGLFFNNVSDLLAKTFPVLRRLHDDDAWRRLVRDYFSRHEAHTPLFLEMPQEFLSFLENERGAHEEDPPFLLELAHYEWVELALAIDETELEFDGVDRDGNLLDGIPVVSPLAWSLAYSWPVHRIGPDFQPGEPGEEMTFLVVYRDRDDEVGFIEINALTAALLQRLDGDGAVTGREALTAIAAEMQHPNPDTVISGGADVMDSLRRRDVVLGTRW